MARSYTNVTNNLNDSNANQDVSPSPKKNFSVLIAIGLFLIFAGTGAGMILSANSKSKTLEATQSENEATIQDLTDELNALTTGNTMKPEEVQQKMYTAADYGNQIAEAQTKCMHLKTGGDVDIMALKDEKIKIMEPVTSYVDANSEGRDTWFLYNIPDKYEWTFNSTYQYADSKIPVLWTLYDPDDGVLCAYVTGTFDAELEMFTGLEVHITRLGMSKKDSYQPVGEYNDPESDSATNSDATTDATSLIDSDYQFPDENASTESVDKTEMTTESEE